MSKYLSSKLTVLYTVLIIMVVYIHSSYMEAEQYQTSKCLQKLIGGGICRIANCLFFCMSGYLFARNINDTKDVLTKLRKRIRSLLPPYVLWNVIFVLWYVALAIVPGTGRFNNSGGIINEYINNTILQSIYNLLCAPAAFHLWFLRDLMVMLAFVPMLVWITKRQWMVAILIALASTIVYPWLVYFWLGLILAIQKWNIENYVRTKELVIASNGVFLLSAVAIVFGHELNGTLMAIANIIGLYAVWSLYDVLAKGRCMAEQGIWKYICGYSFFIYCFHEPAFNIIKKLALAIFGQSETVLLVFYLINPWLMVATAIIAAKLLQHFTPKTYKILTGGR